MITEIISVAVIGFWGAKMIKWKMENNEIERNRAERKAKEKIKEQNFQLLVQKFPGADTIIEYDFDKYVMLKEDSEQIMLNEHIYLFKDIVDFSVKDNPTEVKKGNGDSATPKRNKGKQQETTYTTTIHNYTITVALDSLTSPAETLVLYDNEEATNKIARILTIIMRRNGAE